MPGCVNGFRISDLTTKQSLNHFHYKAGIIMFFIVKLVPKVPLCLRLYRFSTDNNQITLIGVRTPSPTGTIRLTSCTVKTKKNWIEALSVKCFWCGDN